MVNIRILYKDYFADTMPPWCDTENTDVSEL